MPKLKELPKYTQAEKLHAQIRFATADVNKHILAAYALRESVKAESGEMPLSLSMAITDLETAHDSLKSAKWFTNAFIVHHKGK